MDLGEVQSSSSMGKIVIWSRLGSKGRPSVIPRKSNVRSRSFSR